MICFNPRTHTGCDVSLAWLVTGSGVSIHAPTRGATDNNEDNSFLGEFQSTHPHGVRRHTKTIINKGIKSFNPRTHTGCDKSFSAAQAFLLVSIHAPTRGATAQGVRESNGQGVSIHAPTRGATEYILPGTIPPLAFQSTHPHGVRLSAPLAVPLPLTVSIHAPTRGATTPEWAGMSTVTASFNPRTHTGCDGNRRCNRIGQPSFNPRTHTGCDSRKRKENTFQNRFNPRTHTGCDGSQYASLNGFLRVSIHAPTRGAT